MLNRRAVLLFSSCSIILSTLFLFSLSSTSHPLTEAARDKLQSSLDVVESSIGSLKSLSAAQATEDTSATHEQNEPPEPAADTISPQKNSDPEYLPFLEGLGDQLAKIGTSSAPVASRNIYSGKLINLRPQLFVAFGRNWFMLQQCVTSYIAAGWPPEDITVFDNSGTMASNLNARLTVENPAYVNVSRLQQLGVNYERTPTLLTFSQLQNFYLSTALERGLDYYLWSHMDVAVLNDETQKPYKTLYERVLEDISKTLKAKGDWILHHYNFDWLCLVNTASYDLMGGWDTSMPYYSSDCDFHSRVTMWGDKFKNGFALTEVDVGPIYDSVYPLADLSVFFPGQAEEELNSSRYQMLKKTLAYGQELKGQGDGRNQWQSRQSGGAGEPYYKPAHIVDETFRQMNDLGHNFFDLKWHTGGSCPAFDEGKRLDDMWA